jgi:hypothetical protein
LYYRPGQNQKLQPSFPGVCSMKYFGFLLIVFSFAAFAEGKPVSPTKIFLDVIESRQKSFAEFREKFYDEKVCPSLDYDCVLKDMKARGIQSSGDLDNGVTLLSYIIQKKFKKGDCQEICKMNLFAEYSAAMVDFLSSFDRKKIVVNNLPSAHPETKYLVINEELRFYQILARMNEKLLTYRKKIDPSKIFRPELAKRMEGLNSEINRLRASDLLKGSYLSSLKADDDLLKRIVEDGMKNEKERSERRNLVSVFRNEIK